MGEVKKKDNVKNNVFERKYCTWKRWKEKGFGYETWCGHKTTNSIPLGAEYCCYCGRLLRRAI